jgi:hypothetical protein
MAKFWASIGLLACVASLNTGCCGGFRQAVNQWASGPSYSKPAKDLATSQEEDMVKQAELMGYSGLACLLDEDSGASKPDAPSASCKCAKAGDPTKALPDCVAWANSLK